MHAVHVLTWLSLHAHAQAHFFALWRAHPHRMSHVWVRPGYRAWLDAYVHARHRLPGDDLLLGS